jgi:hypothetical protein
MAAWSHDTHIVEHRRWTLKLPADHYDVAETMGAALHSWDRQPEGSCSSIQVTTDTDVEDHDTLVVFYTVTHKRAIVRVQHPGSATPSTPKEFIVEGNAT